MSLEVICLAVDIISRALSAARWQIKRVYWTSGMPHFTTLKKAIGAPMISSAMVNGGFQSPSSMPAM